jgi:V8-like Glu-specific endopeptidase
MQRKRVYVDLLFVAGLVGGCVDDAATGIAQTPVVGTVSIATDFPWAARILESDYPQYDPFCTGTLITARDVLTAQHCVQGSHTPAKVDFPMLAQERTIHSIDVYPQDASPARDLAIIHLHYPVTIPNPNNDPRLAAFPLIAGVPKTACTEFTITGYKDNGMSNAVMNKTTGVIGQVYDDGQLISWAVYSYGVTVTEEGDSGSGLYVERQLCSMDSEGNPGPCVSQSPEIIGVHFSGYLNGLGSRTDVSAARDWILEHLSP